MDIWKVLEIEPCKDKQKITDAYREKLLVTNPEDEEEAFKRLRAAYEEALAYAAQEEDENQEDNSPLGQWMRGVDDVYRSIEKRRDEECWKRLLDEEICMALDTKTLARDRLLSYLMDSFRLPQNIWRLLNDIFDLKEQREELIESFPADFIDYIFREMKESTLQPLDLFQGDEYAHYDEYISLLNRSSREINAREMEDAKNTLEEMKESGIYHPYQTINEIRILLISEEYEAARSKAEDLYMIYPEDANVILYMGETSYYLGQYEEAAKYYNSHLELVPDSFLGRFGKADCLKHQKQYKEAKELLIQILDDYPYNNFVKQGLSRVNELIIEEYKENVDAHPEDMEKKLELGWSCLQNNKIEDGLAILDSIQAEGANAFSLQNLSGRLYMEHGEYEKAIQHFEKWEQMIRELPEEVPEELEKDKNRLQLPIYLQAYALERLGRREEAAEKLEEALAIKEDPEALNLKAYLRYSENAYEEAIEVCNEIEKMDANRVGIYAYRGKSLYELGYYQAAYEDFDRWIEVSPYDLDPYIYKMRIMIYYEQYDRAKEIADYLTDEKVESDRLTDCIAQIMENTGGATEKNSAYEMYKEILENYEKGQSDVDDIYRIIYHMAVADEKERPLQFVLDEIDKGLSYKKDYIPLIEYKAYLMNGEGRKDEAIALFQEILMIDPGHTRANMRIGDILHERKEYKKALEYYLKQREVQYSQTALIDIGRAYIGLGRLDEAKEIHLEALKMDPEESCVYHNLGLICVYQKQYAEAIKYYELAIEYYQKRDEVSENTYEQLAACYIREGQPDKAFETYEEVRKQTKSPAYYIDLSDAYRYYGRYQEAAQILEKYKETADNDSRKALYDHRLSSLMILSGDMHKAYKYMKKCKNKILDMQENLTDYYILKRDYKKALEICNQMLDRTPEDISALYFTSLRILWMGDTARARTHASKGLALLEKQKKGLGEQIRGYKRAAAFQAVLGNYKAAFFCIEKAQGCVLCTTCKYHICKDVEVILAMIYDIMGDRRRAMEILTRCASYCKDDTELYFLIERLKG